MDFLGKENIDFPLHTYVFSFIFVIAQYLFTRVNIMLELWKYHFISKTYGCGCGARIQYCNTKDRINTEDQRSNVFDQIKLKYVYEIHKILEWNLRFEFPAGPYIVVEGILVHVSEGR